MRNKIRKATAVSALSIGAAFAILSYPIAASAAPLTWTLNDVTFDDGGTAIGSFTYDADTNTYSDFDVSVAGGVLAPFTYSAATSALRPPLTATDLGFVSNDVVLPGPVGARTLFMTFAQPLTNAGGSIAVQNPPGLGGDAEFNPVPGDPPSFENRGIAGGTVDAATVPEPSSVALCVFGLIACGLVRRRKQL